MGSLSYCLEHIYRPFEARSLNYNIINLSVLVCLLRGASLSLDCMGEKKERFPALKSSEESDAPCRPV